MAAILEPVENFFASLPLGGYPAGRAAYAGGIGGALAYTIKPGMSFNKDGSEKPWILFDSKNPDAAVFPAWGFIVVPGIIFGLFL